MGAAEIGAIVTKERMHDPAWGEPAQSESRWPAAIAVVIALLLQVSLPGRLTVGPPWIAPLFELALLVPLMIVAPRRKPDEHAWLRVAAIALIAVVNAFNVISLGLLVQMLLAHGNKATGLQLLFSGAEVWLTNVIVFALWYWELDRGGPHQRCRPDHREPDFLFPQMVTPGCRPPAWSPQFIDYLFVSFTNATAFSPTDTMPLTHSAKLLMLVQALASLMTVALVAARAVNILS